MDIRAHKDPRAMRARQGPRDSQAIQAKLDRQGSKENKAS